MAILSGMGLGSGLFPGALWAAVQEAGALTDEAVERAQELAGLSFTEEERTMMLETLSGFRESYRRLRGPETPPDLPTAFLYDPERILESVRDPGPPEDPQVDTSILLPEEPGPGLPSESASGEDLAYASLTELGRLLRSGAVTSVELTELFLDRLRRLGPRLECVVTLTEERAVAQAERADRELAAGTDRGPLHGIPWGAKDLFAVEGYPTTWGAAPFRDQVVTGTATAVRRLDQAGAVLVAKLALGALAMGDVWFGGQTRNPWNPEQGSSGSSAGSAAATAAGLVPFALGTETLGSIVSPSHRCGVTGLRPTFGRVSRAGAMPLSWTMDKVGPLARSASDSGAVLAAIHGRDQADPSSRTVPFDRASEGPLRIGFDRRGFESDSATSHDHRSLEILREAGFTVGAVDLPRELPSDAMTLILEAECGAAFDELTRSDRDDALVRQDPDAWPNLLRSSRFIPAVEYVRANRLRARLLVEWEEVLSSYDAVITPSFADGVLSATNLTGHPAIQMPNGFRDGSPTGISLIGPLWAEAGLLAVARAFQESTDFHGRRPPGFG